MLTNWDQVRDWITDNNFTRWILYKDNPSSTSDGKNFKILDSVAFAVSDQADKLAMTEKYLRMSGGRAWAVGTNKTAGETITEIRLESEPTQTAGVGNAYPSIGELTETITARVKAEMEAQRYREEKDKFEKEKAEFEAEKQSAIGAVIHYFAPLGQQLLQRKLQRNVAGIDTDADVVVPGARKMEVADEPENQEPENQEQDVFTEEETEKLYDLLARFKKVEPQYMELIEAVVKMAENGDATYSMAKGFLVK